MTDQQEVAKTLLGEPELDRRRLFFSALLARELAPVGTALVVVGDAAIEAYTQGRYVSGGVDLVGPRERVAGVLRRWGFENSGRLWEHEDWGISVDIVAGDYSGDLQRTREIVTPFGGVRLAAVEDLLVRRLAAAKRLGTSSDVDLATLLALGYEDEIDWRYVEALSVRLAVANLLEELRGQMGRMRVPGSSVGSPGASLPS